MAVDSQWGNVKLLLPVDGPNNSTTITDVKGHTVTVNGGAKLSTAQYPSGCTSSLALDGNNDYLTLSHADFAFGTGDFAIEMWVYKAGDTVSGTGNSAYLLDFRTTEPDVNIDLFVGGSTEATVTNRACLYVNGSVRITTSTAMGAAWNNVTLSRISGVSRLFINGVQEGGNYTDTNNYTSNNITVSGRHANLSGDYRSFNGYLGPIRITKGNGRGYSSNFTPPSLPFTRPKISGTTKNVNTGVLESKVVVALKRSTLAVDGTAVSAGDGTYTIYPSDFSEHVVMDFDTPTYPLVDGGSGENAIIFDRVIPG